MANTVAVTESRNDQAAGESWMQYSPYEEWITSIGIPVHRAYYIQDLRTIALGRWEERAADAAFIELAGQQGVTGAYVLEIGPGQTTPLFRVATDECVYVLEGGGLTTIQASDGSGSRSFEWNKHSLFLLPSNHPYRLSNASGVHKARILVANYLPLAMSVMSPADHFFRSSIADSRRVFGTEGFYSSATVHERAAGGAATIWRGNLFPDLRTWDKLEALTTRGAGGRVVWMEFPASPITAHMSVFPPRTYKKGHRHGPGFVIVIPAGEGYSLMWPEGGERVEINWHEGSCFVPPFRWFHQHFNTSERPDRYLAIHPPRRQMSYSGELIENKIADQIEYPDENPWIRQKFEQMLANRGLTSRMPEEAYRDPNYEFKLMA